MSFFVTSIKNDRYRLGRATGFDRGAMRKAAAQAPSNGGLKQSGIAAFLEAPKKNTSPPSPPPPQPAAPPAQQPASLTLNPEQAKAAQHGGGLVCVEAGPGSGKTRVIAARAEYLCTVHNVPGYRLLVLTFSNKAASEAVAATAAPRAASVPSKARRRFVGAGSALFCG